jgi:hypothetical protein
MFPGSQRPVFPGRLAHSLPPKSLQHRWPITPRHRNKRRRISRRRRRRRRRTPKNGPLKQKSQTSPHQANSGPPSRTTFPARTSSQSSQSTKCLPAALPRAKKRRRNRPRDKFANVPAISAGSRCSPCSLYRQPPQPLSHLALGRFFRKRIYLLAIYEGRKIRTDRESVEDVHKQTPTKSFYEAGLPPRVHEPDLLQTRSFAETHPPLPSLQRRKKPPTFPLPACLRRGLPECYFGSPPVAASIIPQLPYPPATTTRRSALMIDSEPATLSIPPKYPPKIAIKFWNGPPLTLTASP